MPALALSIPVLADQVSIRADVWYPMNGDPGSGNQGFMIDIAEKVLTANGHTLDYKAMPWERALDQVRAGKFDCVVGAYKSDAPDFVFPQEHWGLDSTGVFVRADDSFQYTDLASLTGRKVGVIKGYAYDDDLNNAIASDKKTFKAAAGGNALESNIKKLTGKRLDSVIESTAVFSAKASEIGMVDKTKLAGVIGDKSPIYIACSPNKPSSGGLVKMFDEGLAKLRASGELASIMGKYGMSDWK